MFRRVAALVTASWRLAALGPVGSAAAFEPAQPAPQPGQHTDSVYPSVGSPGVDARSYALDLRWEPGSRTLRGTARVTLVPAQDGRFRLDLSGRLHVDRLVVTDRAGGATLAATASHRGRYLDVTAPKLLGGSTYDVRVSYHGRPATTPAPTSRKDLGGLGWHTARDGQVWAMQEPWGAFTWYPVNDHPSDKATYQVRLDVPQRWVGVSNGRLVSRRAQHGRTVTRFTNADPVASYLMTVAIGPYRRATQTGPHGLPITYWVPRNHPEYLAPLRSTPSAIGWLESRLGPYPFDRAGVVVTPSDSAMETQTLVTFGARNYRLRRARGAADRRARARPPLVRRHGHARRLVGRVDERGHGDVPRGAVLRRPGLEVVARLAPHLRRATTRCGASSTARPATTTGASSRRSTCTTARPGCWSGCATGSAPPPSTTCCAAGRRSTATRCRTGSPTSRGWPPRPGRTRSR